jgi:mannose-1-phosphate guanylyltransferase
MSLHAIVMAGGSGTRFWPASRASRPKQFLPISGGEPMIRETVARLEGLVPIERVLVVSAESQAELVRAALPELPPENLVLEPLARNTGPCIALAALELARRAPDSLQVVLPADHVIAPVEEFRRTVREAAEAAREADVLITFGVRPLSPATGYGYIELGPRVETRSGALVHAVRRFVEKPARARAEAFLASGGFLWNSGLFLWSTRAILAAFRRHLPEVLEALEGAPDEGARRRAYASLPSVPVDKGIMERAENVRVMPIEYRWSDVGSWAALAELKTADESGNHAALSGAARLIAEEADANVVYAEGDELVCLLGVHDLIVVRSGDVTLVCPRDRAEDVKRLVERLKTEGPERL